MSAWGISWGRAWGNAWGMLTGTRPRAVVVRLSSPITMSVTLESKVST